MGPIVVSESLNFLCVILQTEVIDGDTHEHSAVSKINLVDLAGSERQHLAQTTGDRFRVGVLY